MTAGGRLSRGQGLWVGVGRACLWLGLWACSAHSAGAAEPLAPTGESWRVHQVRVNEWRSDRLLYQIDDPRLVGRTLHILPERIDSDLPGASVCPTPSQQRSRIQLNALLDQSLLPAMPGHDAARDLGLKISGQTELEVRWIACQSGGAWGPQLPNASQHAQAPVDRHRNWIVVLTDGSALLRWYGDTVLVLKPASVGDKIQPSFACAKARWPAERAICGHPGLASYDLSLAQAWRVATQACDQDSECLSELKRSQKQWVARRNQCLQDLVCLRKALQERLDHLMTAPD